MTAPKQMPEPTRQRGYLDCKRDAEASRLAYGTVRAYPCGEVQTPYALGYHRGWNAVAEVRP